MNAVRSALVGLVVLFASAPAFAGLEFTDTVTINSAATSSQIRFQFNGGATVTTGSSTIPNGFLTPPPDLITISDDNTSAGVLIARIEYSYNGLNNGVVAADYSTEHGDTNYEMVIQLGTITGTVTLSAIQFREVGGTFSNTYNINQVLSAADSNRVLFIPIPEAGANGIPYAQRDLVDQVSLTFALLGSSGNTVGVNAVANPEPATLALFGAGLLGLGGWVRRRRRLRAAAKPAA